MQLNSSYDSFDEILQYFIFEVSIFLDVFIFKNLILLSHVSVSVSKRVSGGLSCEQQVLFHVNRTLQFSFPCNQGGHAFSTVEGVNDDSTMSTTHGFPSKIVLIYMQPVQKEKVINRE